MKKDILFLLINYLILSLLFILILSGCSTIPEVTARVELNTCGEVEVVPVNLESISPVYPYLEVAFDNGNFRLSSSNICFSIYLFNANRDTLFVRNFKVLGKNNIELFNIFNLK